MLGDLQMNKADTNAADPKHKCGDDKHEPREKHPLQIGCFSDLSRYFSGHLLHIRSELRGFTLKQVIRGWLVYPREPACQRVERLPLELPY